MFFFNSDISLLSQNEMQLIRGGKVPVRPTSRPRERYDYEEAQTAKSVQNTEELSLIDYIKFWFKNK